MMTTGTYLNVTSHAVDQDDSDVSVLAMSYLMYKIGKYVILFKYVQHALHACIVGRSL